MTPILKRRVAFHETDCMGVVHHSNYVKYFEEARVEMLYIGDLSRHHSPHADYTLAVLDLSVKYLKPLKVGDQFQVSIECHMVGSSRVAFKYNIHLGDNLVTEGQTLHVGLNSELKVVKPPLALIKGFQNYGS